MFRSILVAALVAFATLAAASDVIVATKDNFDDIIAKDDLTLVKFYAPWCGHCKKMAPDFETAATELKGKAQLVDLDATTEKDLASKYGIRGFPTLKLFSKGELISDYKGGRTKDALVQYIERAMMPSIVECADADSVASFVKDNKGKAVVYGVALALDTLLVDYKKASMSVRDAMPDSIAFALIKDAALLKDIVKDTVKDDSVILVNEDGSESTFSGEPTELENWIKLGSLPTFSELNRENAATYTELTQPIFIYFQDPDKKKDDEYATVEAVAKEMRSSPIVFTWINVVELKSFAEHLGVADKSPAIAVYEFKTDVKYSFSGEFSKESLTTWINGIVAGDVKATMKSEPIPETNDEPVKVIVGDSFADIVMDETKDVLIEQYAPWCGHCKKLEPVLVELAKKVANVDTLVIAKMDATKNDAPAEYKAKGYPTLHFFPAGSKTGSSYEGGREVKDFIKFFKESATHKDGLDGVAEEDASEGEEQDKEEL